MPTPPHLISVEAYQAEIQRLSFERIGGAELEGVRRRYAAAHHSSALTGVEPTGEQAAFYSMLLDMRVPTYLATCYGHRFLHERIVNPALERQAELAELRRPPADLSPDEQLAAAARGDIVRTQGRTPANVFELDDPLALQPALYQVNADRHRDARFCHPGSIGLRKLHQHLFAGVFDGAGEWRRVQPGQGGSIGIPDGPIEAKLDAIFAASNGSRVFRASREQCAERLAALACDLMSARPFAFGTQSTVRLLLGDTAKADNHRLDTSLVPPLAEGPADGEGQALHRRTLASQIAKAMQGSDGPEDEAVPA